MAPEVTGYTEYGSQVDIYSFAICLFEMLFSIPAEYSKDGKLFPGSLELNIIPETAYVLNVRQGRRPPFLKVPSLEHWIFALHLIKPCWDQDPSKRPTASIALAELAKLFPNQMVAKQEVKDRDDRIKLLVRGEEFIARRSTLARVRRSHLWELFGGGRENEQIGRAHV